MILPARTDCPPNFFTPRRLLSLSRPLRDEPPAFLCAMSNYFALGDFLAAPLAGAAFSVEAALAVLPPPELFLALGALGGASALSAGGLAWAWLAGAGFGVSGASTPSASVLSFAPLLVGGAESVPLFFPLAPFAGTAALAGAASAFGAAFFSAL